MSIIRNTSGTTETATPDAAMDQCLATAYIEDAMDLLDNGGSREQIMERLYSALDELEHVTQEMTNHERP